jgi:microsomal epoxide hydrolase
MSDALRPYRIDVPEADLQDLRDRLARTRWAPPAPTPGWDRGIPEDYLRRLAAYWETDYDWRAHEAALNAYPQYLWDVEGGPVHVLVAASPEPDAFPLLLTHGWPGSVAEFLRVLGPLTDPRAHGGDPADAFHVVAPSLPGYGFSGPASAPGWTIRRIAEAWAELMALLGHERYAAQGGDWGAPITRTVGVVDPGHCVGVHMTMLFSATPRKGEAETEEEERSAERSDLYRRELGGYANLQSTKPQSLAYALTDSPVGQLAWIVERFRDWTDTDGEPEDAVDRDQLLTNVMFYWLTRTSGSSAQLYYETAHDPDRFGAMEGRSEVPAAIAIFPAELSLPVRRLAERDNRIERWTEMPRGGHFAAMEQPALLVDDIRAFFRGRR